MSDGILSLEPLLRRKRQADCSHPEVEVGDPEQLLTCTSCGVAIDPWGYIRALADEDSKWRTYVTENYAAFEQAVAKHNAWVAQANERIVRLHAEIQQLTDLKNRLYNERVNGLPLGAQIRRRRPRK
jgi:hypothetical protein